MILQPDGTVGVTPESFLGDLKELYQDSLTMAPSQPEIGEMSSQIEQMVSTVEELVKKQETVPDQLPAEEQQREVKDESNQLPPEEQQRSIEDEE